MSNAKIIIGTTGGQVNFSKVTTPDTPPAGYVAMYAENFGGTDIFRGIDSSGNIITVGTTGPAGSSGSSGSSGVSGSSGTSGANGSSGTSGTSGSSGSSGSSGTSGSSGSSGTSGLSGSSGSSGTSGSSGSSGSSGTSGSSGSSGTSGVSGSSGDSGSSGSSGSSGTSGSSGSSGTSGVSGSSGSSGTSGVSGSSGSSGTSGVSGTSGTSGVSGIDGPIFYAGMTGPNQSIPSATFTTVRFDTEFFDSDGLYDPSTAVFTPSTSGYYHISTMVQFNLASANRVYRIDIQVNNVTVSEYAIPVAQSSGTINLSSNWTGEVPGGQGVRVQVFHSNPSAINLTGFTPVNNFSAFRVY